MDAGLLGLPVGRGRRRRRQRLVGHRRTRIRAQGLRAQGGVRRRRAAGPHQGTAGDGRRDQAGGGAHAGDGRRHPLCRRDRRRRGDAAGQRRSGRRRLHLLHLGHHRLSQGRAAHPSRLHREPDEYGLLRPCPGAGRRQGDGRDPEPRRRPDSGGADHHAAVPRHRQQLRRLRRHCRRRQAGADVSLGRGRGAAPDRQGEDHRDERRADHGARSDQPPRLRDHRHLKPADPRRRRRAAAARPRWPRSTGR